MKEPCILFLALFLAIVVKNLQEILVKLTILIRQRDNTPFSSGNVTTSTREPPTCSWIRADIWRQDGAICFKNRKTVPYHGCARILRLTVSIPDHGSWQHLMFREGTINDNKFMSVKSAQFCPTNCLLSMIKSARRCVTNQFRLNHSRVKMDIELIISLVFSAWEHIKT